MASAPRRRALLLAAAAVALVVATALAQRRTSGLRATFPADEDLVYLPRAEALQRSALGHRELMADLVFMRTVLYFATELTGDKDYRWLDRHVDTVIALDPRFHAAYTFGGRATMYNGLIINNRMVESSNHFLRAGIEQFPNDWELAFMLGCNYLFELKTDDPAQRRTWRRLGADWLRRAALAGGGPSWLPGLAATIMTKEGEAEAAVRYLEEAYMTAATAEQREDIRRRLLLQRRELLPKLQEAEQRFRTAWQATLPYAPGDLFVLVGEPRSPRLDLAALTRGVGEEDAEAR